METIEETGFNGRFTSGRNLLQILRTRTISFAQAHRWSLIAAFALVYLAMTCYRASRKALWYDELFTVVLARMPDLSSLAKALMYGVDFNPPLFYLLTRGAEGLVGAGPVGARLPEVIGFGIFCLCLYRFVALRSSAFGGLVAMIFPLCTTAYLYAFEARPHGIVAGFCGLAMVSWQAAVSTTGRRRLLWLAGLGAALAGAVFSHAYGVLLFIPVIMGELTRSFLLRRIDRPMWLVVALASTSCAVLVPLSRLASMPGIAGDWGGRWYTTLDMAVIRVLDSYSIHFAPTGAVLLVAVIALALRADRTATVDPGVRPAESHVSWPEIALLAGLTLLPLFAALLSLATTSSLFERYSISVVGGAAGFLGLAVARRPLAGLAVLLAMTVHVGAGFAEYVRMSWMVEPSSRMRLSTHVPEMMQQYEIFDAHPDRDLPIALVDKLDFAAMFWYAPPALKQRMTYVMPGKSDGLGRLYRRLQDCCGAAGAVSNVADFSTAHRAFLLYGLDRSAYRIQDFVDAGAQVTMLRTSRRDFLALVVTR